MIAYMEGRLGEITDNACIVITAGGVGYEVFLPGHSLAQLPAVGEQVFFYICTVVREDALELFGFSSWDERQTFLVLTSINRIGARTALSILTVFRPDDLRQLVINDDVTSLTRVPGIGKKTAQQLFLELKYKLKLDSVSSIMPAAGAARNTLKDAVTGLMNLGYAEDEALDVVKKILADETDLGVSEILRASLKMLARNRK